VGKDQEQKALLSVGAVINTEIQILTSPDLLEMVVTDLGVENIYPSLVTPAPKGPAGVKAAIKSATAQFKGNLSARSVNPSNVINVSLRHTDPQAAVLAVNKLLEFFKVWHVEIYSSPKSPFLGRQLDVYRQRLKQSEKDIEDFKQENRVFSLDQQRTQLLLQRTEFDTAFKRTQNRIQGLRQKISSLKSEMQVTPENVVNQTRGVSKSTNSARGTLLDLERRKQQLLAKYDESNRLIANINKEIQLVTDFLAEHEVSSNQTNTIGKNPVYLQLETDLISNRAELRNQEAIAHGFKQDLKRLNNELEELDKWDIEERILKRELVTNEKNYNNYLSKVEEARIEEEMELAKMVNITIIQKAIEPTTPIEPRKRLNIAVGIILGAAFGLALAFFTEYFVERGVSTPEEVEKRLGLPVLATVHYKENNK
jgi:uncharacterized protein involved in exopolysaccharide biosynthesis